MTFPIWHWHIENSSICSLRCPRCPRQEVPNSLNQTSLNLEFFQRNFKSIINDVWQITFCGDDGDPIYGQDFLDIVIFLKRLKPNISLRIITNGSYKSTNWWFNLSKVLNQFDEIHFSIDGWDHESNIKYRVNSNFTSIVEAVKTVRSNSTVMMTWAAIAFNFNESQLLNKMIDKAKDLNFDQFQVTKSTKFGSNYDHYYRDGDEPLEPYDQNLISRTGRFERLTFDISCRQQYDNGKNNINLSLWNNIDQSQKIIPMCQIGNKGLYISSEGYFYPCCWMANRYSHISNERFKKPIFDLNTRTIEDVVNDKFWDGFFSKLNENSECITKCNQCNYNKEYATQW